MGLIPAHGDSRGITLLVCCSIMWPLSVLFVGLRIWARHIKQVRFVINDYAIFLALMFGTALLGVVMAAVLAGGLGQHASQVPVHQQIFMAKILVAGQPLWALANTAIKVSILHLYVSLFWTRTFKIVSYSTVALAVSLAGVITLQAFLICRPLAFNWDKTIPGGKCGNINAVFMSDTIINFVLDMAIVILPLPSLWGLQMPLAKKVSVYLMFSIGLAIVVIVGYRIRAVLEFDQYDITYTAVDYGIFNIFETTLGIINTCLPVLRPVIDKMNISNRMSWSQNATNKSHDRSSQGKWHGHTSVIYAGKSYQDSFHNIDDQQYPLNRITKEAPVASSKIHSLETECYAKSYSVLDDTQQTTDQIQVTQEWKVNSTVV